MMPRRWLAPLLVLIFLALLLAKAPAGLLPLSLQALNAPVAMLKPSGSLWRGESPALQVAVVDETLALGSLRWRINPLSLLLLSPSLHLETQASTHQSALDLTASLMGTLRASDVQVELPIALVRPWLAVPVRGELSLAVDELTVKDAWVAALQGRAAIRELVWLGGNQPMPLGDYRAEFKQNDDGSVQIGVEDNEALLAVEGTVVLQADGRYEVKARLLPRQGLDNAVAQAVSFLGKRDAEGAVLVETRGNWR